MSQKFVLIIEDHQEIGEIYQITLDSMGFASQQITDGKEALDYLEQNNKPDLIILDMNLPQVSGHFLFKKIRSKPDWLEVPIIISTANMIIANTLRHELGENDFLLVKPVRPSDLRATINDIPTLNTTTKLDDNPSSSTADTPATEIETQESSPPEISTQEVPLTKDDEDDKDDSAEISSGN
ncbi:MAG: response regulator [Chloroflexi bacterium]|nr:MAG: response regulator [Chloroflexota bacterium]